MKLDREKNFWSDKLQIEKHETYEAPEQSLFDSVSSVSGSGLETPSAANPYFHNEFQQFVVQEDLAKSRKNTLLKDEIKKSMALRFLNKDGNGNKLKSNEERKDDAIESNAKKLVETNS